MGSLRQRRRGFAGVEGSGTHAQPESSAAKAHQRRVLTMDAEDVDIADVLLIALAAGRVVVLDEDLEADQRVSLWKARRCQIAPWDCECGAVYTVYSCSNANVVHLYDIWVCSEDLQGC